MLKEDKQGVACNVLYNELNNNKLSHAYLVYENNNTLAYNFVLDFVKKIFCANILDDKKKIICKRIDEGNYPELKVIVPDGNVIKKQQIIDLQQEFSRMSLESTKKVYIIRDCDKMRLEAVNAMLKFLEEPSNNIIAILMTNNYTNVLSTVVSRCQVIRLDKNDIVYYNEYDEMILRFVLGVEQKGLELFTFNDNFWLSKDISKSRELLLSLFDIMIDMYYDILKVKIGIKNIKYEKYVEKIELLAKKNGLFNIIKKLDYLIGIKDTIKFNVNINLLMDSVIINLVDFSS